MKKPLAILGAVMLIFVGLLSGCITEGQGMLVLKITDAPSDLNISEALVTISSIEVHQAVGGDNNTSASWFIIVEEAQTFDLISLINVTDVLGSEELSAGVYTQIRLHVDQALVTIDGVQHNLTIPSKTIKLVSGFQILENVTTTLILDFDIHESIHETGNGKYILQPTIRVIEE